ncbi:MAG TPA: DUF1150 family protein [Paracoccus sp.]|nr:DUF1150 family protein [Paracoccus sp. (in: a-proteobacteria)]
MDTPWNNLPEGRIAYIREVPVETLSDEIRARLDGTRQVYGIHTETGDCIALTADRRMAFLLARQNDLAPVSAH